MADIPGASGSPLTDLNASLGTSQLKLYGAVGTQLATRHAEKVLTAAFLASRHGSDWHCDPVTCPDDVLLALGELESRVRRAVAADAQQTAAPTPGLGLSFHQHERPLIDESNQPFAGQAIVSRKVVDALANPSQAVRVWSRGPTAGAPTPPEAIAFNLADQHSRDTLLQDTRLHSVADGIRLDLVTRERRAKAALTGSRGVLGPGGCPPPLLKRCLAAAQSLSLSHFPKPTDFEKVISRSGYMQAAELPVESDGKIAFQCLRFAVEAFWPEFDWVYIRQLEDAVNRLLSGPKAAGGMLPASRSLALLDAQTVWEKGMRRIERAATAIRDGVVSPIPPPSAPGSAVGLIPLFADPKAECDAIWDRVTGAREMNTRAAIAASLLANPSSPAAPSPAALPALASPPGGGVTRPGPARYTGYTCTLHRDAWNILFPETCQFYAISGRCTSGTCRLKHEPLPAAAVDAHVMAVGARVNKEVTLASIKDG
jgi:hypothetical protein